MLNGKSIIVTGAGSGIGQACAEIFAADGAKVIVNDRNAEEGNAVTEAIRASGHQATFVQGDVTSEADVQKMVETAVATYGRLDGAVNNAGVAMSGFPVSDLALQDWSRVIAINLTGVFLCMKHELAQMLAQTPKGGSIVNTASVAGLVGLPMGSHYVAAKHGVVGLTKTAAMEYAQDGIRVNCVNPGYVTTPMTARSVETRLDAMMSKVPMARMGVPEEIAEGVVWMLSDRASFMTGASHVIDGGYYAA